MSNPDLDKKWADAFGAKLGEAIPVGRIVVCDGCNDDCTDSPAVGGILFGSNAYCPKCAPRMEASAKKYGEEEYIRDRARDGESFGDFVRRIRGPDAFIRVSSGR